MRFILTSVFCIFLSALGATAQEAEAPAQDDTTAEEADTLRVGQPYIREEFGDWAVRCVKAAEGREDSCNLYQLLFSDEGASVAEFNIFELPGDGEVAAGATVVVPLETLLTENLIIAVDGQNARAYPFNFCNSAGCVARIGFTQAEVDEFKRGVTAIVRIVPAAAPEQEVLLDVSLLGFTAGYDSVPAAQN